MATPALATPPGPPPPEVILMQMVFGKAVTQAVSVAARFRIADQLVSGPKTAAELAAATGLSAGHLYRVMRALAGLGVFAGDAQGKFSLRGILVEIHHAAGGVNDEHSASPGGLDGFVERPGEFRDLSVGGAYVLSNEKPAFGTAVKLTLQLPALMDKGPSTLQGIVRWIREDGFGVLIVRQSRLRYTAVDGWQEVEVVHEHEVFACH